MDAANTSSRTSTSADYIKWINQPDAPVIFTHQFITRVLKTRWDPTERPKSRNPDLRRLAGRRLGRTRPASPGREVRCLDEFQAVPSCRARPTSAERRSRRAACRPGFVSTSENALLENALKIHWDLAVKFKVEKQDENVECGISARYVSDPIDVVIFNFTDKKLHNKRSDLSFIYDTMVREILRQDVRSVLREMPR